MHNTPPSKNGNGQVIETDVLQFVRQWNADKPQRDAEVAVEMERLATARNIFGRTGRTPMAAGR